MEENTLSLNETELQTTTEPTKANFSPFFPLILFLFGFFNFPSRLRFNVQIHAVFVFMLKFFLLLCAIASTAQTNKKNNTEKKLKEARERRKLSFLDVVPPSRCVVCVHVPGLMNCRRWSVFHTITTMSDRGANVINILIPTNRRGRINVEKEERYRARKKKKQQ